MASQILQFRALASALLDRYRFFRQAGLSFNGDRDMYSILGYPDVLTAEMYRARYARGGVAKRIVEAFPKATWRGGVELYEDEDPEVSTEFEQEWEALNKRLQIWSTLLRSDILAGLSTYSVLLIGAPGDMDSELPKGSGQEKILYLTPFLGGGGPSFGRTNRNQTLTEGDCSVQEYETDPTNPRFGEPKFYQLKRTTLSIQTLTRPVHWTRVIHIAEGCLDDNVFGQPTLESVWNLLDDLDKVTGGGAEAFWLRANQGVQLDIDKDITPSAEEKADLQVQAEEYKHQITRMLRTRGVTVNPLGSDVANFGNPAEAILTQIAGTKGIPLRILTGSERGELASSQDAANFDTQVQDRRTEYAGPKVVRRLVDRLIEYGYLPTPKDYDVEWPVIDKMTEMEKAKGAYQWAQTNSTQGSPVYTDAEIREHWHNLEPLTDKQIEEEKEKTTPEPEPEEEIVEESPAAKLKAAAQAYGPRWYRAAAEAMEFTDRYQALGIDYPDPATMCKGDCEGTGWIPVYMRRGDTRESAISGVDEADARLVLLWAAADEKTPTDDGWHFVRCPDCAGSGRALQDKPRKFSSTQIQLAPEIAESLLVLGRAIPDEDLAEDGREDDAHITVKYGLHTDDAGPVFDVVADVGPIAYRMGHTSMFVTPEADVIFVEVQSPGLRKLNSKITTTLDVTDTKPFYRPHATVAYVKKGLGGKYIGNQTLAGMEGVADAVTFCPAEGEKTSIPLATVDTSREELIALIAQSVDAHDVETLVPPSEIESEFVTYLQGFGMRVAEGMVPREGLRPSSTMRYASAQELPDHVRETPILITADGVIIDGHRRWIAHIPTGESHIRALQVNAEWADLQPIMRQWIRRAQ